MPPRNPNEARIVRFTNIFDFDYTHAYGGVPYQLRAGVTQLFPWVIGDHLATHLARQALIRKAPIRDENSTDGRLGESSRSDRPLWDDTAIEELKARIMKDAYVEETPVVLTEAETMRRKVLDLNGHFPEVEGKVGDNLPIEPSLNAPLTSTETANYLDKSEVIAELVKRKILHNPRASRANLEKLLQ